MPGSAGFHAATSIEDALAALAERQHEGAVLAGATWIMRARLRGERQKSAFVAISGIEALRRIEVTESELRIGAAATHAELAGFLAPLGEFHALRQAAANSANPAVRNMATVGGNLCAIDFAAADLVPALLCLGAQVELRQGSGEPHRMPMPAFLATRKAMQAGTLLTRVMVPRRRWRSAHIRLPLRKAGDYPVAIVSAACAVTEDGSFSSPRIAVGSVGTAATLWPALERKLDGRPLDPTAAAAAASEVIDEITARDSEEAPGWYRLRVLPSLVRRAVEQMGPQS